MKWSKKLQKKVKKPKRPADSREDKIRNLHILLSSESFNRWPLGLRFFEHDIADVWEKLHTKIAKSARTNEYKKPLARLRPGMKVMIDFEPLPPKPKSVRSRKKILEIFEDNPETPEPKQSSTGTKTERGPAAVVVDYSNVKLHLQKSLGMTASGKEFDCALCHNRLSLAEDLVVVCRQETCTMTSHISCLAEAFLQAEGATDHFVPTRGPCPECRAELEWSDLVQELTLRIRGQAEITNLFKEPGRRRTASSKSVGDQAVDDQSATPAPAVEANAIIAQALDAAEEDEKDDHHDEWHYIDDDMDRAAEPVLEDDSSSDDDDSDDNDTLDTLDISNLPALASPSVEQTPRSVQAHTIPNSDWDDIDQIL